MSKPREIWTLSGFKDPAWNGQAVVEVVPLTELQLRPIVCSPVPGRDGVEFVPDWYGITHHG